MPPLAIAFAQEGADIAAVYLNEHEDAEETRREVEQEGRQCLLIAGEGGDFRRVRPLGTPGRTRGDRAKLGVSGQCGLILHDRPDPAPQRRRNQRLIR